MKNLTSTFPVKDNPMQILVPENKQFLKMARKFCRVLKKNNVHYTHYTRDRKIIIDSPEPYIKLLIRYDGQGYFTAYNLEPSVARMRTIGYGFPANSPYQILIKLIRFKLIRQHQAKIFLE